MFDVNQPRPGRDFQIFPVREYRGIPGRSGLFVWRVVVRCSLIFPCCPGVVLMFKQKVGKLIIDRGRFGVVRERVEKFPVPALRFEKGRRPLLGETLILVQRMIMIGQILQIGLEKTHNLWRLVQVEVAPILGL